MRSASILPAVLLAAAAICAPGDLLAYDEGYCDPFLFPSSRLGNYVEVEAGVVETDWGDILPFGARLQLATGPGSSVSFVFGRNSAYPVYAPASLTEHFGFEIKTKTGHLDDKWSSVVFHFDVRMPAVKYAGQDGSSDEVSYGPSFGDDPALYHEYRDFFGEDTERGDDKTAWGVGIFGLGVQIGGVPGGGNIAVEGHFGFDMAFANISRGPQSLRLMASTGLRASTMVAPGLHLDAEIRMPIHIGKLIKEECPDGRYSDGECREELESELGFGFTPLPDIALGARYNTGDLVFGVGMMKALSDANPPGREFYEPTRETVSFFAQAKYLFY